MYGIRGKFLLPENPTEAGLTAEQAWAIAVEHLFNRYGLPRFWADFCKRCAAVSGIERDANESVGAYLSRVGNALTLPQLQELADQLPPTDVRPTRRERSPSRAALRLAADKLDKHGEAWYEQIRARYGLPQVSSREERIGALASLLENLMMPTCESETLTS